MPKKTRLRAVLVKDETDYGTANGSPSSTGNQTDAILCTELTIEPIQADEVTRELIRTNMGNYGTLLANIRGVITITCELTGSGDKDTPPQFGRLISACGFNQNITSNTSVQYSPVSNITDSVSIYFNADGIQHKLLGCRGTFSIQAEVGQIPTITFVMTGIYSNPTTVSLPTCAYKDQADALIFKDGNTSDFVVHSFSGACQSFSLELNNDIVYRELVGGTKEVHINNRAPSGTIQIENPVLSGASGENFFLKTVNNSEGNARFLHGTANGNKVKLEIAKANLAVPAYNSLDDIDMLDLNYTAVPDSGNDEFTLTFL